MSQLKVEDFYYALIDTRLPGADATVQELEGKRGASKNLAKVGGTYDGLAYIKVVNFDPSGMAGVTRVDTKETQPESEPFLEAIQWFETIEAWLRAGRRLA